MITVMEITDELSGLMPDYIVERKGNVMEMYTRDRKVGMSVRFTRKMVSEMDKSNCLKLSRLMTSALDRAVKERGNAS